MTKVSVKALQKHRAKVVADNFSLESSYYWQGETHTQSVYYDRYRASQIRKALALWERGFKKPNRPILLKALASQLGELYPMEFVGVANFHKINLSGDLTPYRQIPIPEKISRIVGA